ncbi:hypothetical protein GA0115261_110221, partial [Streptomyces sp. OspMP-M43]
MRTPPIAPTPAGKRGAAPTAESVPLSLRDRFAAAGAVHRRAARTAAVLAA